ncbi:MAG: PorT family protein [Flavobacteriales bacterium]|nr:PorT family protein [Flavobacteriales bacterium]
MYLRKILVFLMLLCIKQSFADDKYQLNFFLAPSYENISFRSLKLDNQFFFKYSYNFGTEIKYYFSPKVTTNIGLQFNDRGFQARPEFITSDGSVQTFEDAVVNISAKYLTIPIDLHFNFQPAYRTEVFFGTGIGFGLLVGQSFKGRRVSEELGRPAGIYEGVSNERTNINWFDKNYVSWNFGVGISRYIKSRLVITINPYYSRQIDRARSLDGPLVYRDPNNIDLVVEPKFDSYGLNLKLGYYFSDQIENKKKSL